MPVRKGGVVVSLDDPDREGGEHILDEGLGDVVSHLLGKLHDPESAAAVDGCVLVQSSSFHQVGHELDVYLNPLPRTRDDKGPSVALRSGSPFTGQAGPFQDSTDGEGRGDPLGSPIQQELPES